jgi:hypothetical protein
MTTSHDDPAHLVATFLAAFNDGDVDLHGTATDVARRGADGAWRYVIDNPFGTALPA